MNFALNKTFMHLIENPHIMLIFAIYLTIMAVLFPSLGMVYGSPMFWIFLTLMFLFTTSFCAGWLGLIKCAISYDGSKEDIKSRYDAYKESFFASIPVYMLSLILFFVILCGLAGALEVLANYLYPLQNELVSEYVSAISKADSLAAILDLCPPEVLYTILKRNGIVYGGIIFYLLLTLYSIPALYFSNSKNPFIALKNGFLAFIKKPFETALLFFLILFCHFFIIFVEIISLQNAVASFFALILRVYFVVYVVMVLFSVYEKNFTNNSNNGSNCIRQDGSCNTNC